MVQHADKLAALDRRESDLKAQQHSLANDAQAFKDKEGETQQPFQCILHLHMLSRPSYLIWPE